MLPLFSFCSRIGERCFHDFCRLRVSVGEQVAINSQAMCRATKADRIANSFDPTRFRRELLKEPRPEVQLRPRQRAAKLGGCSETRLCRKDAWASQSVRRRITKPLAVSFCPLRSFTTKAEPVSSTDQGGGKRRLVGMASQSPTKDRNGVAVVGYSVPLIRNGGTHDCIASKPTR